MVKQKWIKNFQLRDKQDIRDGCDVQVIEITESNKLLNKIKIKLGDTLEMIDLEHMTMATEFIHQIFDDIAEFESTKEKRLGIDG